MIRPFLKKTAIVITGGFRTASGMAQAIKDNACDGIGIGRPLGAEPYLCKELLSGRITGGKSALHSWACSRVSNNASAQTGSRRRCFWLTFQT